jgi:hypothetical protein
MCALDRDRVCLRLGGARWNAVGPEGVDAEMAVQGAVCSATDFVPVFYAQRQPSQHLSAFDLLGDTREHQYCEQIRDITTR